MKRLTASPTDTSECIGHINDAYFWWKDRTKAMLVQKMLTFEWDQRDKNEYLIKVFNMDKDLVKEVLDTELLYKKDIEEKQKIIWHILMKENSLSYLD